MFYSRNLIKQINQTFIRKYFYLSWLVFRKCIHNSAKTEVLRVITSHDRPHPLLSSIFHITVSYVTFDCGSGWMGDRLEAVLILSIPHSCLR